MTRLTRYREENNEFPDCMIGFGGGPSTQDAFLQLKPDIFGSTNSKDEIILAVDLKGAFDNVSHEAILKAAEKTGCGKNIYDCIATFLSNRTVTMGIGNTRSGPFEIPNKGTPQGSVISPLLFNLTVLAIGRTLEENTQIGKSVYADDITIWTKEGTITES